MQANTYQIQVHCFSRIQTLDTILRSTLLFHKSRGDLRDKIEFLKERGLFPSNMNDEQIMREPYFGDHIKGYRQRDQSFASVIDSMETFPSHNEYSIIDKMFDEGYVFDDQKMKQRTRQISFIMISFDQESKLEITHFEDRFQTCQKLQTNIEQIKQNIRVINSQTPTPNTFRNLGPPPLITQPLDQPTQLQKPTIKFHTQFSKPNNVQLVQPRAQTNFTQYPENSQKILPVMEVEDEQIEFQRPKQKPIIVKRDKEANFRSPSVANILLETQNLDQMECPICSYFIDEYIQLKCSHQPHLECQKNLWQSKYQEGKRNIQDYKCLLCQTAVDIETLTYHLPNEQIQQIQSHSASKSGNTFCPYACGAVFIVDPNKTNVKSFDCPNPSCKQKICTVCKQKYHGEVTKTQPCPSIVNEIAKGLKGEPISLCPQCFIPYLKDDNCDHVKCTCGVEFCFLCSAPRQPTMDHGNHFHRDGCKYYAAYTDPKEYRPEKCKACKANGKVCEKPESLKAFNLKHKNQYMAQ